MHSLRTTCFTPPYPWWTSSTGSVEFLRTNAHHNQALWQLALNLAQFWTLLEGTGIPTKNNEVFLSRQTK
eukprot:3559825-Prorocentrum_lima.AAC.1